MSYDDLKTWHNGQIYKGMKVGGKHFWIYPNGKWNEVKVSPDRWSIEFTSEKRRKISAPFGSGVSVGTSYHWLIVGSQIESQTHFWVHIV